MFLSNLAFDFDLIFGSIFTFRGPIVLLVIDSKTVLGSAHVVSFSMFPSILTFDFDLIWGHFLLLWGRVQKLFWGLVIPTNIVIRVLLYFCSIMYVCDVGGSH